MADDLALPSSVVETQKTDVVRAPEFGCPACEALFSDKTAFLQHLVAQGVKKSDYDFFLRHARKTEGAANSVPRETKEI